MSLPPSLLSLQPLLGSLPVSMIATDGAGIVLAWNSQAEKMYGWSAEEAIGHHIGQLVVAADGRVALESIMHQLRSGRPWEGEYKVRRRDGRELTLHVIDSPLVDENGALCGLLGLAVDVSEERLAPVAVLEAVVANTATSVTVVGADDCVVLTMGEARTDNDARSTPVGRKITDLWLDPCLKAMVDLVRTAGSARQVLTFGGRTYDSTAVALPDFVVGPGGVAFVATDVTERVAESRRFRALIENTQDVTSILARDGSVLYISPVIERLSGYPPGELVGSAGWSAVHPDDLPAAREAFATALERPNTLITHVFRSRHRDGTWRDVEQTIVNRLDDPAIGGLVAVASDVTERLAAESRLLSLNRLHAVLSETGNASVRAGDPLQLLADACRILVGTGGFAAAAFTTTAIDAAAEVLILAEGHGTSLRGFEAATRAAVIAAVRAEGASSGTAPPARGGSPDGAPNLGMTILLFPVVRREHLPGVLALCVAPGRPQITEEESQLLAAMVRDVAFGLDSLSVDRHRLVALKLSARRAQQQSVVSRLGLLALGKANTGDVIDAAVASVAGFGVREATVHELMAAGDELLVRAVAGDDAPVPRGGLVARRQVPLADEVLASGQPVTVDDLGTESRLHPKGGRTSAPTGGCVSVPIRVDGATVAALTVRSLGQGGFDPQDVHFYESVANVISGTMERSRYENGIRHDAMHDRLTGLPNRSLLNDRLAQALFRRRRRQSGPLAVLLADLDGFKRVNDSLGHATGDSLLALAASRLREVVRPSDTVARLDGDEFVILCEDLVDTSDAAAVAGRIIGRFRDAFSVDGQEIAITISIGIAASSDEATPEGLLRDADLALYRAKEAGRSRYELVDDALRGRLGQRVELEEALRHALDRGQLVVAYQPVVDLATGDVREAEALLRWTREDGTPVSPAEFIPIAEQSGMIVPIGAWVLLRACEDAVRWNAHFTAGGPVGVAVNLSARQISDRDLVPAVVRALEITGLGPDLLRLEITETALMEEGGGAAATLQALDDLGVRLSIDDFGTGYSSLMYLRRYPVRALKVDRYFVAGLGKNSEDEAIVQAVIALAHSLGLSATAEGVETVDQLTRLRALACDSGQGYLWSKAVDFDQFVPVILAIRASAGDPVVAAAGESAAGLIEAEPMLATVADEPVRRCRVVLADDSPSDRGLLRRALEDSGDFTVVGEAADGEAAIKLAARVQPELLVLDMSMTGMNGLEALAPINRASPGTVVVFLSGFLSGALAEAASQAGAFAQFDKSLPMESLVSRLTALRPNPRIPLTLSSARI